MAATGLGLTIRDTYDDGYQIMKFLGGQSGRIIIAEKIDDHQRINGRRRRVALRKQLISRYVNSNDNEQFTREILRIMTVNASHKLRHPNIVEIEDVYLNNQAQLVTVSDFYTGKESYVAPEFKDGKQYDNKVDIWSLGIVLYYLMTGTCRIKKEANLIDVNRVLSNPQELKGEFLKLIKDRQQYNKYQCYVMNYYFNQVKSSVGNSILSSNHLTYQPANISLKIRESSDGYKILDQIAHGLNASVFKAKDLKDKNNKIVALKQQDLSILNFRKGEDLSNEVLRIMREIATFQLKHPNIVEILDSYLTSDSKFIIVSELAKYDLAEFTKQSGKTNYSDISTIMIQLLEALEEVHCKGFIHRDINPQNILVFDNNIVKICDFGIASFGSQTEARLGKIHYMAPEVLRSKPYDKSVDIWSLGILLYYLCHGTEKQNMNPINIQLMDHVKIDLSPQCSKFQEIFDEMTTLEPNLRPSIPYLKEKFMKFIDNTSYYQNYQNELIMFKLNQLKNSINLDYEQLFNLLQPHLNNKKFAYDKTSKRGLEDFRITIKNLQNLVINFQQRI
ncbi:UNKNOWN [Stylonychia lemnae]|uniref:non-specific serine/threonine protein kinase n=1 Tax=Stylonychia lemnae TaxID=5949 RepID=A0A078B409_STYLE|nr:UNKNOWN [Stylonychia lemnae]|eukprot:CDW88248.1 UNKNOWN [Stylonychia lemnae]